MPKKLAERQIVVESVPQRCFEALVDFESYPAWQSTIRRCEVLTRDRDGRAKRVRLEIDTQAGPSDYTLEYSYEHPHLVTWELVDGHLDRVKGELVLEDRGDGTTLATVSLRSDGGRPHPPLLDEQVMQRSVEDLKARVESSA
jgi:ribosome-associated toxin RatA of RatAB toxin-antitoxin module